MDHDPTGVAEPRIPKVKNKRIAIKNRLENLNGEPSPSEHYICFFYAIVRFVSALFSRQVSVWVVHNHCICTRHVNYLYLKVGWSLYLSNLYQSTSFCIYFWNGQSQITICLKRLFVDVGNTNFKSSNNVFFEMLAEPPVCRKVNDFDFESKKVISYRYEKVLLVV